MKADTEKTATFEVKNPATGATIANVPEFSRDEVASVVDRLRSAQPAWEKLDFKRRYSALKTFGQFMLDNEEEFTDRLVEETGKARSEAPNEILVLGEAIRYYGRKAAKFLAEETPRPHSPLIKTKSLKVVIRPQPVVGLIGPWNFPINLTLGDAVPALMAGCAVVIKPSEFTPLTLSWLVRSWVDKLGLPPVLEVVTGLGKTGEALVDVVDFIGFTGSAATGRKVAERAGRNLTPFSLELGGKDPMLVLKDADLDRAAAGAAWGGLSNSGQICMSVERVYAEEPIYQAFVDRLVERVGKLRQGSDHKWADVGAMTTPQQLQIVKDHVSEAVEKGAKVLTGGREKPGESGDYYEPTVLVDVDHSMQIMTEETFGPVLPVMKVRDEEEAIRLANDSRYGLSSSVWSKDKKKAERVARRIESGACNINDVMTNYMASDVPFGGWKESGVGYRHGPGGIRKYCRTESLVIERLSRKSESFWFPYSKKKTRMFSRIGRFLYGRGLRGKLSPKILRRKR